MRFLFSDQIVIWFFPSIPFLRGFLERVFDAIFLISDKILIEVHEIWKKIDCFGMIDLEMSDMGKLPEQELFFKRNNLPVQELF